MKPKKGRKKMALIIIGCVLLLAVAAVLGLSAYAQAQMKKIPAMSFEDCISYSLEGSKDGLITVGVIKDGEASYTVYGTDGAIMPKEAHTYEIGSITKTFTAALIERASREGKIDISATLDRYLDLPEGNVYPTVADVLTHTSGLSPYYLEAPMIGNKLAGRNDFCGITDKMTLDRLAGLSIPRGDYPFNYSNYGYAVLGLVLESVYGEEYTALVNSFAADTLGLRNTMVSDGSGELGKLWQWNEGDAYISAGAITSNIEDMLEYARMQLGGGYDFSACHRPLKAVNATSESNGLMSIRMDSIGMAWITDEQNGIVWHNGGTGSYNSYLGFCPRSGTAVVVLSNLAHNYRIPATVAGVKLLMSISGD